MVLTNMCIFHIMIFTVISDFWNRSWQSMVIFYRNNTMISGPWSLVAFAIWWKLFSKSEHKPSSHSGHHWSACFVIYWASRIPHIIVRDVVIFTYKRIKKDIPMELNFGTDIENTGIIIYVLAIFHFICYFMSCELSLFSTQCKLNVVIILRSCISVGIVVFSWLYQVCCLFLVLSSFVILHE
jgi:hypothetical protein